MLKRFVSILVLSCAAAVPLGAADSGYFGTWKLNAARSDFGPVTVAFARAGDEWTQTQDGKSYTFKMDGKAYPTTLPGATEVWKQADPSTWEVTTTANGKILAVDSYKLSADGKTLTDTTKVTDPTQPGGGSAVFHRTGGGPGLAGGWTGTFKQDPFTLVIERYETDGVIYRVSGAFDVKGRFDGKPYPMTGRSPHPGVRRRSPRQVHTVSRASNSSLANRR